MTVQRIQFCPSLQLLQSFIALKGYLTQRWMAISLFQFYRKTFLWNVDPKNQKISEICTSIYHWNFPKGRYMTFQEMWKILRGGAKRSQRRRAPPHTSPQNPVMIGWWIGHSEGRMCLNLCLCIMGYCLVCNSFFPLKHLNTMFRKSSTRQERILN
jgi:hypothetical protein